MIGVEYIPSFPRRPSSCPFGSIYHRVRLGDSLYKIAVHYGVTLSTILSANPQITNPNIIYIGEIICIPTFTPTSNVILLTTAPISKFPKWFKGVALLDNNPTNPNTKYLSLLATLPEPEELGYAKYISYIEVKYQNGSDYYGIENLIKGSDFPLTWIYRYDTFTNVASDKIFVRVGGIEEGGSVATSDTILHGLISQKY